MTQTNRQQPTINFFLKKRNAPESASINLRYNKLQLVLIYLIAQLNETGMVCCQRLQGETQTKERRIDFMKRHRLDMQVSRFHVIQHLRVVTLTYTPSSSSLPSYDIYILDSAGFLK